MDSSIGYKVSWLDQLKLSNYTTNMHRINEMYTFIIYGVVGVGLLGVEFSNVQKALVVHTAFVLAFDLNHLLPSLSDIHLLDNDKYSD